MCTDKRASPRVRASQRLSRTTRCHGGTRCGHAEGPTKTMEWGRCDSRWQNQRNQGLGNRESTQGIEWKRAPVSERMEVMFIMGRHAQHASPTGYRCSDEEGDLLQPHTNCRACMHPSHCREVRGELQVAGRLAGLGLDIPNWRNSFARRSDKVALSFWKASVTCKQAGGKKTNMSSKTTLAWRCGEKPENVEGKGCGTTCDKMRLAGRHSDWARDLPANHTCRCHVWSGSNRQGL